jgi:DNA-binding GntR family transcriptional regulator
MPALAEINRIEHHTLGEQVYRELREMLISGRLAPGERTTLRGLSAALGTSAMPVRDALRQLLVDQAIELLPNRVFRVPIMTRTRFIELRDIRLRLEGLAVERAAQLITQDELRVVDLLSATMRSEYFASVPNASELIVLNKDFHFGIYRAARMAVLLQIIEGLWTQIGPVLSLDVRHGSRRVADRISCEHHDALVKALAAGDSRGAVDALTADTTSAGDYILSLGELPP